MWRASSRLAALAVGLAALAAIASASKPPGSRYYVRQGGFLNLDYGPCLPCMLSAFLVAEEGVVEMLVLDAANYEAFTRREPYKALVEASVGAQGDPPYRFLPQTAVRLQENERLHVVLSARRSPPGAPFASVFFVHHVFTSERSQSTTITPGQGSSIAISPFPCPCTVVYEVATGDPGRQLVSVIVLDESNYAALKEGRPYATYTALSQPNGVGAASVGPAILEETNRTRIHLIMANAQAAPITLAYTATVTGTGRPVVYVAGEAATAGARAPEVTLGGRPCADAKVVLESYVVSCTVPPGAGHHLPVAVRAATGQESAPGEATFSYAAPSSPPPPPPARRRARHRGGQVRGENFGEVGTPVAVWIAGAPCTGAAVAVPTPPSPARRGRGAGRAGRAGERVPPNAAVARAEHAAADGLECAGSACLPRARLAWLASLALAAPPTRPRAPPRRPGPTAAACAAAGGRGGGPYVSFVLAAPAGAAGAARLQLFVDATAALCSRCAGGARGGALGRAADGVRWGATNATLLPTRLLSVPEEALPRAGGGEARWAALVNAGVRRARGEFVFVTNHDVVLSEALAAALATRALRPDAVYLARSFAARALLPVPARTPAPPAPPRLTKARAQPGMPLEELLRACMDGGVAAPAPHLGVPREQWRAAAARAAALHGPALDVSDPADVLVDQPQDGLLLHRTAWCLLRGCRRGGGGERAGAGAAVVAMAVARGLRPVLFNAPAALFRLAPAPGAPGSPEAAFPPRVHIPGPEALHAARTRPFALANPDPWGLPSHPALRETPA
eukprot:tig00001094_g6992.t1